MEAEPGQGGAPQQQPKTKEQALEACVEDHLALVACFKTCSLWSAFTGCCVEEHKKFWGCYTTERGTNATKVTAWLDDKFGATQPQDEPESSGGGSSSSDSTRGEQQQSSSQH